MRATGPRATEEFWRQFVDTDLLSIRKHTDVFHGVSQFADIARPVMAKKYPFDFG